MENCVSNAFIYFYRYSTDCRLQTLRWVSGNPPLDHCLKNILGWNSNLCQMSTIKLVKTKRNLLYLKTQSVPRCKHFSSRL